LLNIPGDFKSFPHTFLLKFRKKLKLLKWGQPKALSAINSLKDFVSKIIYIVFSAQIFNVVRGDIIISLLGKNHDIS
jgi:hypothetical protein